MHYAKKGSWGYLKLNNIHDNLACTVIISRSPGFAVMYTDIKAVNLDTKAI